MTSAAERQVLARARFPSARVVTDLGSLLSDGERAGLVVIATPNRTHVPLALRCVSAGISVVVDKPLASSVAEAKTLTEAARQHDCQLTVFHNRRWDGDFLTVSRLCAEGHLGIIHRFESRFERWRPLVGSVWRERPDPGEAGGLLYDLGTHLIDQALLLLGPVRSVYAELRQRRRGAQVDDDTFLALTHCSGAQSHLWVSHLAAHRAPRFRVLGTKSAYVKYGLDVQAEVLAKGDRSGPDWGREPRDRWGYLHTGDETVIVQTERGRYPIFYEQMRDAIRGNGPVPVQAEDALWGLEVIEAAKRSDRERRVVEMVMDGP